MPRRAGTNFQDRNEIKRLVEEGETNAERIAANLNLEADPVARFVKSLTAPKAKRKPRQKAEETADTPELSGAAEGDTDNE